MSELEEREGGREGGGRGKEWMSELHDMHVYPYTYCGSYYIHEYKHTIL